MKFKHKIDEYLKSNVWLVVLTSILSVLVIALTLTLVVFGYTNNIWAYILYLLSAITLTYLVYVVILFASIIKQNIINSMKKNKFLNNLLEDYGYRTVIFAGFTFALNVAYAIFQAVIAIMAKSIWLGSLATYYIVISVIRGLLVKNARKNSVGEEASKIRAYRNCGILLLVLNLALVPAIVQIVQDSQGFAYAGLMIYVMATYAFYKLTISIINLLKAKKLKDYSIQAIKNLSFADALVSILALQTALLSVFGDGSLYVLFNALTGGAVSITIISIGIFMIVKGQKKLKIQKENIKNEQ